MSLGGAARLSRRAILAGLGTLPAALAGRSASARDVDGFWSREVPSSLGVEVAKPLPGVPAPTPGVRALGIGTSRDGMVLLPGGYRPHQPAPLLLWLHGAGGSGATMLRPVAELLDGLGIITVAPDSRGVTWDMEIRRRGEDMAFIADALRQVLARQAVDPDRIAVGGFSDGASFALALGLSQSPLFRRVLAFSPGFLQPYRRGPRPAVLITHGTHDRVLPVEKCGRAIARTLRRGGYEPEYREFDGGHEMRPDHVEGGLRLVAS